MLCDGWVSEKVGTSLLVLMGRNVYFNFIGAGFYFGC
jgi:hypothetical protein